MNERIVGIIGITVGTCVIGSFALAGLSKSPPDEAWDVVKVGLGILGGLVVGTASAKKTEEPVP